MSISNGFPIIGGSSASVNMEYYIPTVTQSGSDYVLSISVPDIKKYEKGQVINIERIRESVEITDANAIPTFTGATTATNTYGTWTTNKPNAHTSTGQEFDDSYSSDLYITAPPGVEFLLSSVSFYVASPEDSLYVDVRDGTTLEGGTIVWEDGGYGSCHSSYSAGTYNCYLYDDCKSTYINKLHLYIYNSSSYSGSVGLSNLVVQASGIKKYTNSDAYDVDFESCYININNLGNKKIKGSIVRGGRYSLIYNGEAWEILPNSAYDMGIIGTAVANGTNTYTKTLGYRPSFVVLLNVENDDKSIAGNNASSNYVSMGATTPRFITKFSSSGMLLDDGFKCTIYNSSNGSNKNVYFIAFR